MDSVDGSQVFQLGGDGAVVDAAFTTTGDKVATCADNGTVQVWACTTTEPAWELLHVEELQEQATQLAWGHPAHGLVLALGTVAGVVHVLQGPAPGARPGSTAADADDADMNNQQPQAQQRQRQRPSEGWCVTGRLECGEGAVSALAFAPHQQGLVLAAACADRPGAAASAVGGGGCVRLFEASGAASSCLRWTQLGGIQVPGGRPCCLCWREASVGLPPLLVVGHGEGGSIWAYRQQSMSWQEVCRLAAPGGGRRPLLAAHWAPALGRPHELLAASFGEAAAIFRVGPAAGAASAEPAAALEASLVCELRHPQPVWRLEFNLMGNTLACSLDPAGSGARPEVWMWMPPLADGPWAVVSRIRGGDAAEAAAAAAAAGGGGEGGGGGGDMVD